MLIYNTTYQIDIDDDAETLSSGYMKPIFRPCQLMDG